MLAPSSAAAVLRLCEEPLTRESMEKEKDFGVEVADMRREAGDRVVMESGRTCALAA